MQKGVWRGKYHQWATFVLRPLFNSSNEIVNVCDLNVFNKLTPAGAALICMLNDFVWIHNLSGSGSSVVRDQSINYY